MRILIVSWHFAPYNAVGAVRAKKLAAHLRAAGHDVRVVTARGKAEPMTLPLDIPETSVTYTRWVDVEAPAKWLARLFALDIAQTSGASSDQGAATRVVKPIRWPEKGLRLLLRRLSEVYFTLAMLPDKNIGWYPFAVRAGSRLLRRWRPDIVYATGPPFTSLVIAAQLARKGGCPWVAELRDPWFGTGYVRLDMPSVYERLQGRVEGRTLASAAAVVTTADALTAMYAERYGKPAWTVYNGFDPREHAESADDDGAASTLVIAHTGHIYPGRRDPSALFDALRLLPAADRDRVRIDFYGGGEASVAPAAQTRGVTANVRLAPAVAYRDSLAIQRRADLLLLLQWNDPHEAVHIPAKLFEYLGSARPILGLGYEHGVPARLIRDRGAGLYDNDPQVIADYLRRLLDEKDRLGRIADLPASVRAGLSRAAQFERLRGMLETDVLPSYHAAGCVTSHPHRDALARVPVDLPADEPLRLIAVCDTEDEFDWHAPLSRDARSVTHLHYIGRVQEIFERHGIRPVYAVDHLVAENPAAAADLVRAVTEGRAELGTHLRPWVSPPYEEALGPAASFRGNMPEALERAKLTALTDKIAETFDRQPVIYKAGRYGLGANTPKILAGLGYAVDVSPAPPHDASAEGGPDFSELDGRPFWFADGSGILSIPNTGAFVGRWPYLGPRLLKRAETGALRIPRAGAALARLGLVERLTLSNEGHALPDLQRLTRHILANGGRTLVFSFHSPSVVPGFTPYVRSDQDLARFLETLDGYLSYAVNDLGAVPASPLDVRAACRRAHTPVDCPPATTATSTAAIADREDAQPGAVKRTFGAARG